MQEQTATFLQLHEGEITYITTTEIHNTIENSQIGGNTSQQIQHQNSCAELALMQEIRFLNEKVVFLQEQLLLYKKIVAVFNS